MGETFITIITIGIGVIILFVFPLVAISEMQANEVAVMAQTYVTEFVDQVRNEGKITTEAVELLQQKLNALGNTYGINIEVQIADVNPGKKTANQQVGDTTYYSEFMQQIEVALQTNGVYYLKEGDFIIATINQTNTDIHQMLTGVIYGLTGQQPHVAQAAGTAVTTGR